MHRLQIVEEDFTGEQVGRMSFSNLLVRDTGHQTTVKTGWDLAICAFETVVSQVRELRAERAEIQAKPDGKPLCTKIFQ